MLKNFVENMWSCHPIWTRYIIFICLCCMFFLISDGVIAAFKGMLLLFFVGVGVSMIVKKCEIQKDKEMGRYDHLDVCDICGKRHPLIEKGCKMRDLDRQVGLLEKFSRKHKILTPWLGVVCIASIIILIATDYGFKGVVLTWLLGIGAVFAATLFERLDD